MAEYIDREAAIAAIRTAEKDVMADYGPEYGSEFGFSEEKAVEIVNSIPAADVAPVVHGRWVRDITGQLFCSECKQYGVPYRKTDCCPNCGAKMDLEE